MGRGGRTEMMCTRLPRELVVLLGRLADEEEVPRSELVRRLVAVGLLHYFDYFGGERAAARRREIALLVRGILRGFERS